MEGRVCGGIELNVDSPFGTCSCFGASVPTVRPCTSGGTWGGINTETCGAPSQTMTVVCQ